MSCIRKQTQSMEVEIGVTPVAKVGYSRILMLISEMPVVFTHIWLETEPLDQPQLILSPSKIIRSTTPVMLTNQKGAPKGKDQQLSTENKMRTYKLLIADGYLHCSSAFS